MKPTIFHALASLASRPVRSTTALSSLLSVSQQTAWRWLSQLVREGLAEKKANAYCATQKGTAYLASVYSASQEIALKGTVFTGMGEGRYYLSRKGYEHQFIAMLGFKPYPGTLNLKLDAESIEAGRRLRAREGLYAKGFVEEGRAFGGARCHPALIQNKIKGAVVVPERAHYDEDVMELLAPVCLRRKLHLKDGDTVGVRPLE